MFRKFVSSGQDDMNWCEATNRIVMFVLGEEIPEEVRKAERYKLRTHKISDFFEYGMSEMSPARWLSILIQSDLKVVLECWQAVTSASDNPERWFKDVMDYFQSDELPHNLWQQALQNAAVKVAEFKLTGSVRKV